MKKILISTMILMGYSLTSAQLHLGAKAGATLSKIDGQTFDDSFNLGYHLGGYVGYDFSKVFGMQVEVQFNQTNTKVEDRYVDVLLNAFDKKKRLNYITVPILLKLNTKGLITFVGGPQFSFLADGNETIIENGKKLFKDTDFGLVGGVEVNLSPIVIYGRYIWGYSKVSDIGGTANSQQIQVGLSANIF